MPKRTRIQDMPKEQQAVYRYTIPQHYGDKNYFEHLLNDGILRVNNEINEEDSKYVNNVRAWFLRVHNTEILDKNEDLECLLMLYNIYQKRKKFELSLNDCHLGEKLKNDENFPEKLKKRYLKEEQIELALELGTVSDINYINTTSLLEIMDGWIISVSKSSFWMPEGSHGHKMYS